MKTIKLPTGTFRYDPAKPLGQPGGFGQVFAGETAGGDEVAIKKLHVAAADAAHRELRIADELKGRSFDHVIPFIDSGEDADSGDYFVVMVKAEKSLQTAIDREGALDTNEAVSVLLQITTGLLEVGDLVHRDLKPDNVLLHDGKWKIADFGIARFVEEATATNTLKGCLSPCYAAPEQWRLERATHATDVYALGCAGFCLLTGEPPFTSNPEEQHQKAPLPPFPCTDTRLRALINMMLRKLPETRPVLSRIHGLLTEIVEKPPMGAKDPLSELVSASAEVAEREQILEAQRQTEEAAKLTRSRLAEAASAIIRDSLERLWGKIHGQVLNAIRIRARAQLLFECRLGGSSLTVKRVSTYVIEPGTFAHSGWDVVTSLEASVTQLQDQRVWSSSLWYAKLKGCPEYRWYEVSYYLLEGEFKVFGCFNLNDADLAAANIMHSVAMAFGPITIDDEKEDEFHGRWIWLLAKASIGQLQPPSSLPIKSWPPF